MPMLKGVQIQEGSQLGALHLKSLLLGLFNALTVAQGVGLPSLMSPPWHLTVSFPSEF